MKIRLVGAELFHVDGWTDGLTDMTKLIVAFRNFTNVPYKEKWISRDLTIFNSKQFPVIANTSFDVLHGPYTASSRIYAPHYPENQKSAPSTHFVLLGLSFHFLFISLYSS